MLTVRELMKDLDVRLVGGEGGLHLPVRWVHISELLDPTPWLSGGELLLTTGLQLDSAERQREFITRLADHHLSGLGFGTGFEHQVVPEPLLEIANEREFPVFEVPYEVPFIAITEAAFSQLVNEQYAVLRRALTAQERLERIVLSERGLEALVAALATLIGAAVLVFDSRGEPIMQRAFRRTIDREAVAALQGEVRERARRREARAFMPPVNEGNQGLALPVAADGSPQGGAPGPPRVPEAWLVAIKDHGPLSDFDRLTLHQAVTIVALELLRARVAGDTERRLAGDVLDAVVRGELSGGDLARRLAPFGLADRVAAVVVQRPNNGRGSPAPIESTLLAALRDEAAAGLVASTGPLTCALVPGIGDEELFLLASRVGARLNSELGVSLGVGVGRAVPGGDARRSFHEARCAGDARDGVGAVLQRIERGRRGAAGRDLQGPGLVPIAALAPGRRGAEVVLRLDPRPDRGERGALRRRADAVAGGVHRGERPVGARGAAALLPPAHVAIPNPARRGADRAKPWQRPRPDRVLARAARAGAGGMRGGDAWGAGDRRRALSDVVRR
jgi:purine catabolism regulator